MLNFLIEALAHMTVGPHSATPFGGQKLVRKPTVIAGVWPKARSSRMKPGHPQDPLFRYNRVVKQHVERHQLVQ